MTDHPDPYKQMLEMTGQATQMLEVLGKQAHTSIALLMCARLEKNVQWILEASMPKLSKTQANLLFKGIQGPLSTFYAKIEVAYSLGLIDHREKITLHAIRNVRNEFAHSDEEIHFDRGNIISIITTSKEALEYGVWTIIGNRGILVNKSDRPWEEYRNSNWIGLETFDPALVEDFLNAFFGLMPWDDWADPNFLNSFLIDLTKKPKDLIYIKK